jgi:hypothetical protein
MANQRQYEPATVFNARIVDMRHLWTPSTEYMGKKADKPNFFAMFIVPKTQAQWFNEPGLAGISAACGKLYASNPQVVIWPVVDGDMPNAQGKQSEFAKGHWIFSASTANPPNVELVQANGTLVKLPNKVGVKSGDYTMTGVTAAVKQNDPRGVKLYLNAVVFSSPGEEIVFANSVSGAELMQQAQRQGLQVAGFGASPGFGGAAPGGFPGQAQPGFGGAPQGTPGFPPQGQPGFTPSPGSGGYAPTTGFGGPAPMGAPAPGGPAFGGSATSPFSPGGTAPFGQPAGGNPFPPR